MTHPRQQIRERVSAMLDVIPGLAGRVVPTRTRPTDAAELPVALIYTLSETSELITAAGDKRHTLALVIELRISASGALDDAADALCQSVEAVMATDSRLGGLAFMSTLSSTVFTLDGEGETRQFLATLTYTVIYDTAA